MSILGCRTIQLVVTARAREERRSDHPWVRSHETRSPRSKRSCRDFIDDYAIANRQKPGGIATKRTILNLHLVGAMGDKRLDAITTIGLEWGDVDLVKRQMCIQRFEWRGHVTSPKGSRLRYVPMPARLASALQGHRHLRSSECFAWMTRHCR